MTTIPRPTPAELRLPVGRRVAFYRSRRGLTQQGMADLLGKSKSWVDKVERGERGLEKLSALLDVATALRVPLYYLAPQVLLDLPPRMSSGGGAA